ncbi:MAG: plasmid pRiA4b ORF-3 family protein [Planctomycetota bacterium]|jgi:hypothetical protein
MSCENNKVSVYQLRVWLREISPAIWRRLLIQSDSTITDLHYTLQIAMGWTDLHLHKFIIHGKQYGVPQIGGIWFSDNLDQVKLGDFCFYEKERFVYEYDFGDSWQHEIRVEKHLPLDPKQTYPVCIGGARQAPPEDCGGPWAYMAQKQHYSVWYIEERLLDILAPENLDEDLHHYREELMTFQYWLSAERFDRHAVNRRLRQYALGDEQWQWE